MKKNWIANLVAVIVVVGIMALAMWLGGCAHVAGTATSPGRNATPIEQILAWNASLATANQAVAQGVIAAQQAGEIDVPTANSILMNQSLIADADRQLTPILAQACTPATAPASSAAGATTTSSTSTTCTLTLLSGNAAAIQGFVSQIQTSSANLIKNGTAGIKNATKAAAIQTSITAISTLIQNIALMLQQQGVLQAAPAASSSSR